MKKLAITGATGKKSGGAFVELLSKNIENINNLFPDGIRAIVRPTSNTNNLVELIPDVEIVKGEITDIDFLKQSLRDVDTLIHISGIHYSKQIVDAAVFCGVRRLVLVHTTGIYSKYKAAGEEYRQIDNYVYDVCKKNNIMVSILRPTMIYGNTYDNNVIKFIKMVDKLPIMPVVNGANYELQPVNYIDLAQAYYDVLAKEELTVNRDFILSGGQPILLKNMLKEIAKNLGKEIKFISCPFPIAYAGSWVIYLVTLKRIDMREKVQRLCEPRVYSHEDATNTFGYNPMCFEQGIVNEVKEYLQGKI